MYKNLRSGGLKKCEILHLDGGFNALHVVCCLRAVQSLVQWHRYHLRTPHADFAVLLIRIEE